MAIMLILQCPVPVHSRVDMLPRTWETAGVVDLYVSIVATCYNVFVLILMHNTEYSVLYVRYVNILQYRTHLYTFQIYKPLFSTFFR